MVSQVPSHLEGKGERGVVPVLATGCLGFGVEIIKFLTRLHVGYLEIVVGVFNLI